jgi:hypothetical protein
MRAVSSASREARSRPSILMGRQSGSRSTGSQDNARASQMELQSRGASTSNKGHPMGERVAFW